MRPLLDRDRLGNQDLLGEDGPASDQSSDLVLGAPALLGIFFALALLCAVFFGFGYSSGHGLHLPGQSAATLAATASPGASSTPGTSSAPSPSSPTPSPSLQSFAPEDAETGAPPQPASAIPSTPPGIKPSPDTASSEAPGFPPAEGLTAATTAARSAKPSAGEPSSTQNAPAYRSPAAPAAASSASQRATQYRTQAPAQLAAAASTTAAQPASTPPASANPATSPGTQPVSLMVQIAAVSRAADAETLATALRHDGFPALVRTSTTDAFFHVQVGPFPTRDAAKAMRARLVSSGYNAFIRQ